MVKETTVVNEVKIALLVGAISREEEVYSGVTLVASTQR